MANRKFLTEAETLELYRVSLDNVERQPEIAAAMADRGYEADTINQGKSLLANAMQLFETNRIEDDETSAAYAAYSVAKENLENTYGVHRKLAKVVFKNDGLVMDRLSILGGIPKANTAWLGKVKTFYSELNKDPSLQTKLERLKVSVEEIQEALNQIDVLEAARSEYLREKGESQKTTQSKDNALEEIDDYMSDFYAVAKVALASEPQLLESMGKLVKS
jgi:hypothetical protein